MIPIAWLGARWMLALALLAVIASPRCADDRVIGGAASGRGIHSLRVGEHFRLGPRRIEVGFQRVTEDSRCPTSVTCVWEGEAGVRLWVLPPGRDSQFVALMLPGTRSSDPAPLGDLGYQVTALRLDPYPFEPGSITESRYVLKLQVDLLGH
ncbi:MAG TPA: hypothetical protein VGK89_13725 [Candidatus Eisenbacteria bacterium]|jgi:hypothetical protein